MNRRPTSIIVLAALGAVGASVAVAQDREPSLMSQAFSAVDPPTAGEAPHALRAMSLFAIAPPELRVFKEHDLVQIIVRESSRAESTQELDIEKDYLLDGKIAAWPHLDLWDILQLRLEAGTTDPLPAVKVNLGKAFEGAGDYLREDEFTARISAEVIEILPNGNLILEARTHIQTDEEEETIKVTGVCRPEDISAANTILSSQIHDLAISKMNEGQLKKTTEKGIITKIMDLLFAF